MERDEWELRPHPAYWFWRSLSVSSPRKMAERVMLIGLGNIGRGMSKNIAKKTNLPSPLLVYNRTRKVADDFIQRVSLAGKVAIADSIEAGVDQSDVIFLALSNDAAVEAVVQSILKSGDIKGKLVIDTSTIHPDTTEKVAAQVTAAGAAFVAAPVFGAAPMAEAGQLMGVLAGPKDAVQRARTYFKGVTARAEVDMSDQPYGKALTLKLVGNTFIMNMVEQLAEGLVLAETTGLGTEYVKQWIDGFFPGPYAAYAGRMLSGDYYQRESPMMPVDLARKDIAHAISLAKSSGAKLPNAEVADAHLAKLKEHVGEKGDLAALYGVARMEAGLEFENKK